MKKKFKIFKMALLGTLTLVLGGCSGDIVTTTYYFNPNWTPDGKIISGKWSNTIETNTLLGGVSDQTRTIENKYEVVSFDVSGNNEVVLFNAGNLGGDVYITMSPNGSYVTVGSNLYTSSGTLVGQIVSKSVDSLDWSADSNKLVADCDGMSSVSSFDIGIYTLSNGSFNLIADGLAVSWLVTDNIIYRDASTSSYAIKIVNSDGTNVLTSTLDLDTPTFVPSSDTFVANLGNVIYQYQLPGFDLVSTASFTEDRAWRWHVSPDGTKITFGKAGTQPLGYSGVWVMDINGGNLARVR